MRSKKKIIAVDTKEPLIAPNKTYSLYVCVNNLTLFLLWLKPFSLNGVYRETISELQKALYVHVYSK